MSVAPEGLLTHLEQQLEQLNQQQRQCRLWADLHERNIQTLMNSIRCLAPSLKSVMEKKQSLTEGLRFLIEQSPLFGSTDAPMSEHLQSLEARLLEVTEAEFPTSIGPQAIPGVLGFALRSLRIGVAAAAALQDAPSDTNDTADQQGKVFKAGIALQHIRWSLTHHSQAFQSRSLRPLLRALTVEIDNFSDYSQICPLTKIQATTLISDIKQTAHLL
jgi:hypothetical protein